MTGHQNQCAKVIGICALVNIVLNFIAIPTLGILGAGLATGLSMALWNIWLNTLVVKYLDVNPSIVAALRS
jgi:O-antigen/teichoic acid export membrane protein